MRITRTGTAIAASLLALVGLSAQPASAFDPDAIFGPHFESVPLERWGSFRPASALQRPSGNPLMDTALFQFIDRLPLEPTSIGPEPKLPNDPEPAMGLVFVVSFY